ncbi:DNA methyltransferase [Romboutsia ilealis]|uniref:DNA methyltransferase n=1 Tax=Romboutsia ilealis TaxID=1115758 RepID=UPI002573D25A|nr:DNA methyltransferase [Romboutsia ilealis]
MSIKREKFINTLKPMFEADKAELDFGVYKIINQKREQINDFLDNKLSKDIEQQLSDLCSNEEEKINTEEKVYSHLTNFFGRYYDEGDFISKRRYKEGVYAIPYEGEEVKLYWANHDQYYIKSAENFKDYSFKLGESKKVNFKLVEAAPEINNNKALDENKLFVLKECDNFISIDNNEMTINFEYVGFPKTTKQDKLNKETLDKIIKFIESKISQEEYREFYTALRALDPTPKNKKRTVLEKELAIYTSKNSFDYFIHKDLGGFLRRELDFYIKNEVLFIDDIGTENEKYLMDYVNQVKIIKCIANKIIKFLEQIENFQKKLWLKKKFVVESNYCITLDRIARFDNLDEETNGLLIHSDNFQALNTIENKYNNSIDMIYIDPPYNTDSNEIIYKNNYKHSSFLSLINDRLNKSNKFLSDEGSMCCAIDKAEQKELGLLIQQNFADKDIHCITVIHNPRGIQGKNFSYTHEYVYYAIPKDKDIVLEQIIPQDEWKYDNLRNWGGESERKYGKTLFYPIYINSLTNEIIDVGDSPNDEYHPKNSNIYMDNNIVEVWPIDANGIERKWRYSKNKTLEDKEYMMIKTGSDGSLNIHAPKRTQRYKTMWNDSKYDASVYGKKMLTSMLPKSPFSFPKSLYTVKESLESITLNNRNAKIMDFFGGSGTTGHATIQLNREDKGSRKYILVEMGEYFNIVTKPRIQKAIYSSQWKNGKPVDRDGISHMFKYMNLEQYEDTLNNIVFDENKGIKNLNERLQEEYTLSYMLDMESKDSNALLNINKLTNPFEYKLNIERNNETNYRNIDLVETFNYLLGLHVEQISAKESYNYDGETIEKYDGGQYIFKRVEGKLRDNKKVLIVWRNLTDDIKTDNDVLNAYFDKKDITLDEYDYVYINGDNTIAINNYSNDKVKLIDEEFKTLMFDVDNI